MGPKINPDDPNKIKPPTNDKNISKVCCFKRLPTSIGLSKLSTVPITKVPHNNNIIACVHWPFSIKNMAAGNQITAVPNMGITAKKLIITPHNIGAGKPSTQNIRPPNKPCTAAIANVPYTMA